MVIYRSVDIDDISKVLNHPRVFHFLTDDLSPAFYEPVISPQVIYLMNKQKTGVVRIDPMNGVTCNAHIATLPEMWGDAVSFVKEALVWGFKNTKYLKVLAMVPEFNEHAIALMPKSGFVREGVLRKSFLKNWKLHDQIVFGLCKGDCLWQ